MEVFETYFSSLNGYYTCVIINVCFFFAVLIHDIYTFIKKRNSVNFTTMIVLFILTCIVIATGQIFSAVLGIILFVAIGCLLVQGIFYSIVRFFETLPSIEFGFDEKGKFKIRKI